MHNNSLHCSNCDEMIIKSIDGVIKLRQKLLIVKEEGVFAVCKGCSEEVRVPLRLDTEVAKSLSQQATGPKLYLFNKK